MSHQNPRSEIQNPKFLLRALLLVTGLVCLCALGGLFMPIETMRHIHQMLGLGELPEGPVVQYLARSASGLYAFLGGLMVVLSWNVRAHRGIVRYTGWAWLFFGILLGWIDWTSNLPLWWTVGEAIPTVILGLLILILERRMPR